MIPHLLRLKGFAVVCATASPFPSCIWDILEFRSIWVTPSYCPGGMAEWSKAAVLKTVECNSSVGSNPTPSAIFCN